MPRIKPYQDVRDLRVCWYDKAIDEDLIVALCVYGDVDTLANVCGNPDFTIQSVVIDGEGTDLTSDAMIESLQFSSEFQEAVIQAWHE